MPTPSGKLIKNSVRLPTPNKTPIRNQSKSQPCKTCSKLIVDGKDSSIACDICDEWVHSEISCSRLKKSIFKLITTKDPYVCPNCIKSLKKGKNPLPYEVLQKEYKETVSLAESLLKQKKELEDRLSLKEAELLESQHHTELEGQPIDKNRSWTEVVRGPRGGRAMVEAGPRLAVPVSNSFEVLAGEGGTLPPASETASPTGRWPTRPRPTASKPPKKPRLVVVGDSHARNCGEMIRDMGGRGSRGSQALAVVLPGAPMATVIQTAKHELKGIGEKDLCFVVGGTNDISDESVALVENKLGELISDLASPSSLVLVETPYLRKRDDDINKTIARQNEAVKKFCIENKIAYLNLNTVLNSKCYTSNGMHLNKLGKETLCSLILAYLTSLDTPITKNSKNSQPVLDRTET